MLVNFDEPDASLTSCRRDRSNTPLQALNLLNDPVFVEAAQALSARLLPIPRPERIGSSLHNLSGTDAEPARA